MLVVPAFTRVIARRRALEEAETTVEKLHEVMPRQQFEMKIMNPFTLYLKLLISQHKKVQKNNYPRQYQKCKVL